MKALASILVAAMLAASAWAQQSSGGHEAHHPETLADGEVRKVDKEAKKITLRHGPLASLDMPAMTMVFQVSNPAMLEQVKVGDKVKFQAEKVGGAFTITRLEPAK